jgi:hypothetical protein
MKSKIVQVSDDSRPIVIEKLKENPGQHSWALQDQKMWPAQSKMYYHSDSLDGDKFTYLLLTVHPGAQQKNTLVLNGNPELATDLIGFFPKEKWLIRETPATMASLLHDFFPHAVRYDEERMQVERSTARFHQTDPTYFTDLTHLISGP